jgi:hypothetical protein
MTAPAVNVPPLAEPLTQRGGDPDLLYREIEWLITEAISSAPRTVQVALGPSEIGDPCARRIGHKLLGTPPRTLPPNWKATIGTFTHAGLAEILDSNNLACAPDMGGQERWIVETRVDVGEGVSGTVDAYDRVTATQIDWKTCGRTMLRKYKTFGPGAAYQLQAHLYGLGLTRAGHPVDTVMIIFLPRQGELSEAYVWHEPFDRDLAEAALQRFVGIRTLVELLGNSALDALPMAPEWCTHCPFYRSGCEGHPDSRPPLDVPALTFNDRPAGFGTL